MQISTHETSAAPIGERIASPSDDDDLERIALDKRVWRQVWQAESRS